MEDVSSYRSLVNINKNAEGHNPKYHDRQWFTAHFGHVTCTTNNFEIKKIGVLPRTSGRPKEGRNSKFSWFLKRTNYGSLGSFFGVFLLRKKATISSGQFSR
jgi:hypothetical protein